MNNMKRVALVTTVPETFATILCDQPRYLSREFGVSLISSPGEMMDRVVKNEGVAFHTVAMKRGISPFFDIYSLLRMILSLLRIRPALVHSYTPKAGLVAMLAAFLVRVPVRIHTFTGLIFPTSRGLKRHLLILIDRLICACATHVVPEGLGVQQDLARFQITLKPMRIIGNGNIAGVDTAHFSPVHSQVIQAGAELRARLKISRDEFVFCFIGRLNKDKGLGELMAAFATLAESSHLILAGGYDATAPVSPIQWKAINSHPRVHVLGFLEDIRPVLSLADVFVLPSYREGFPNVLLQAGAMGLPVIATDINGCNEIIENRINGWLIPPRDALALTSAMQDSMALPSEERAEMGRRARMRIAERFEREQYWIKLDEFYRGLLQSTGKAVT